MIRGRLQGWFRDAGRPRPGQYQHDLVKGSWSVCFMTFLCLTTSLPLGHLFSTLRFKPVIQSVFFPGNPLQDHKAGIRLINSLTTAQGTSFTAQQGTNKKNLLWSPCPSPTGRSWSSFQSSKVNVFPQLTEQWIWHFMKRNSIIF